MNKETAQRLFNYMSEEHGVILLETDIQEIEWIICPELMEENYNEPFTPHKPWNPVQPTQMVNIDKDKAWDAISVLGKLVDAADILLHKKDYDGHGWEEIEVCYKRGKEILQDLKAKEEGKKARKHNSPKLQEILDEVTPSEMEQKKAEMEGKTPLKGRVNVYKNEKEFIIGFIFEQKEDCDEVASQREMRFHQGERRVACIDLSKHYEGEGLS